MALTTHTSSSAEVEGRVELYICSPSRPSWSVIGWPLPLLYLLLAFYLTRMFYSWLSKWGCKDQIYTSQKNHTRCLPTPEYQRRCVCYLTMRIITKVFKAWVADEWNISVEHCWNGTEWGKPMYRETQNTGTFEKPNKNWINPTKKYLLTEIEPLQLAFQKTVIQIISVWKLRPVDGVLLYVCILSICRWGSPLLAATSQLGYHEFRLGFFVSVHPVSLVESCRPDS